MGTKVEKFRVHLPYECLFDLRWGFIRRYSELSEVELYTRFDKYCGRLSDDLRLIDPGLTRKFKITPEVVRLSPRTAILTIISNAFRQYAAEKPDTRFKLHISLDFSDVPFISKDIRRSITDVLKATLSSRDSVCTVTPVSIGYEQMSMRKFRESYECAIVYDINNFSQFYNIYTPKAYHGLGIITRPLFIEGTTPEEFHTLINTTDKRSQMVGSRDSPHDHYDLVSDVASFIGPIYFHQSQYFSALTYK